MNKMVRIQTPELDELDAIERWHGHTPSPFDWQALLVFRSGLTRIYQFSAKAYDLPRVIKRAHEEAKWDRAIAFLVRDTVGKVVHCGPVTDALGNPLEMRWREMLPEDERRFARGLK